VKAFVQAAIDECLKLERALMQVRAEKTVVVVHYAPIAATAKGEMPEIFPYLGTSRLAEVVDRHGADLVLHGHAHHGCPDGTTTGGVPVRNVAIHLNLSRDSAKPYRVFDV
jgi:Icc-related predicted phosphoesterase